MLTSTIYSQEVISAQGESYSNANNTMDFTLGEIITETFSNGTNDLTQGFHQTLVAINSVEDFDVNFLVTIFPNPSSDQITLNVEEYEGLTFNLYNIQGVVLEKSLLTNNKTTIELSNFPKGIYLLALTKEDNQILKTYRLIKE